ncbi:putative transmembrane cation transporter [Dietzia sp. NCCP-2495]|uniref:potassium channel family protein n=1 Tax=Dietzia sp. NCCP-2495 TaxID=2934675 RepID=UPI0022301568|nr:potassium channel family protein [Dietzia sp. NCCP-2495]GLB62570.1 putative transmembrane cation transporter [Dietzia sp. NCCP-2495]
MAKKRGLTSRFRDDDPLDESPDHILVGVVSIPENAESPWRLIGKRILMAIVTLFVAATVVYLDRDGYEGGGAPDGKLTMIDSIYYATVSLSTTGYGDITPVTQQARLVNTIIVTPLRLLFLILLVGTTLSVLTEQSRQAFKIQRWRKIVRNHTVVVGYGTKGRSAIAAMLADDTSAEDIVVVDTDPQALKAAAARGLVTVHGSATRSDVLKLAGVTRASAVVVATNTDDTAVLVTLTVRELAPNAKIVATVRESDNTHLLKQSGADSVVVSAETTGRLLGLATITPTVVGMMEDLLTPDEGFSIAERRIEESEVGGSPRHLAELVLGVVRKGQLIKVNEPEADALEAGDRLLYIKMVSA